MEIKSPKRDEILLAIKNLAGKKSAEECKKLESYLGSPYKVLGLSRADYDSVIHEYAKKEGKKIASADLNNLADSLWTSGKTFEERTIAIALLDRFPKLLDKETWTMIDRWVDQASGWALCDDLGSGPISKMLHGDFSRSDEILRWTRSENFWRRRITLYSLRDFVSAKELDFPFVVLERLLYDKEFWVQRAVGTWLRECWKKDRKKTEEFLLKNSKGLPKVVITVATERAPKSFREKLRSLRE